MFWLSSRYYSPELCRFISPDDVSFLDPESVNRLNLYCYCMNNPISYADPSGHSVILAMLIGVGIDAIVGAGVGQASNTSDKLGIAGWKKFWYSVSGIFVGDFLVSLNNWGKISQTIMMEGKYNFKFDQNPFYSFWNAPLYAMYLKNNQYKDEDSRTTLGLYLELQAHYLFYW